MKSLKKSLAYFFLVALVSPITLAADLSNGQDISNEAISVANQYQAIAHTIKTQGDTINALGEAHSALNISLVEKVKAIIKVIEFESENLINLVMNENAAANSKKLDSIIANLEAQRKSLATFITPQLESTPEVTLTPESKQEIVSNFQVYQ